MKPITARQIVEAVSEESGVSVNDLYSMSRQKTIVAARKAAYIVMREVRSMSYPECAKALGRSCHSSVMQACSENRADARAIADRVKSKLKPEQEDTMTPQQMIEWAEQRAKYHEVDAWKLRGAGRTARADACEHMADTARAVAEYIRRKEADNANR